MNVPLEAYQFKFELQDENGVIQTAYNDDAGAVGFAPIRYTAEDAGKVFTYTIAEIDEGMTGVSYDATVHTIDVKVEKGETGKLHITPSVEGPIVFENRYTATGTFKPFTDVVLENGNLSAGQFSFRITQEELGISEVITNDADGHVAFSDVNFTAENIDKRYTFTIEQIVDTPDPDITYDQMITTFTVFVPRDMSGTLEPQVTPPADNVFNNKLNRDDTWAPVATKELSGRPLQNGDFTFVITGKVEGTDITREAEVMSDGSVTFAPIEFTQPNESYTFRMYEKIPVGQDRGMQYDTVTRFIYVRTYVDGEETKFTVDYSYAGNNDLPPLFNNSYTASGSWSPLISKLLEGRHLEDGEFTFELRDEDTGALLDTVQNDASGNLHFEPLTFDEGDIGTTFHFAVVEKAVKKAGILYDPVACRIDLTVLDGGDGELLFKPYYQYNKDTFVNQYILSDSWSPKAYKELYGAYYKEDQFHFVLKEGSTIVGEAWSDISGYINFDPIVYNADDIGKTFTYEMSEIAGADPDMVYDDTAYTYTVKVDTDDNGDIALEINSLTPVDVVRGMPVFVNRVRSEVSWIPDAKVKLEGRELKANDFTFVLYEVDSDLEDAKPLEGGLRREAKNAADGTLDFGAIQYSEMDIGKNRYYKLEQIIPADPEAGMTYDSRVMLATITLGLEDPAEGVTIYYASWFNSGKSFDQAVLVNKYAEPAKPVTPTKPQPRPTDSKVPRTGEQSSLLVVTILMIIGGVAAVIRRRFSVFG